MTLSDTTRTFLQNHFSTLSSSRFLVGVSGGPDSMVLLDVLADLRAEFDFDLVPVHVNYRLHDRADRAFSILTEYCRSRGLSPVAVSILKPGRHREASEGLEARARKLRFNFFKQISTRNDSEGLFLAHHQYDQVETILLNLGRGCGPGALAGMSSVMRREELSVYRPLLPVAKKTILEYADQRNLEYVIDPTNDDEGYARNKLRHSVIPEWERAQPAPAEAIVNLGERVKRENDFWRQYLEETLEDYRWPDEIQVDRESFTKQHPATQYRFLRAAVETLAGSTSGWNEQNLRDVRELFAEGRSGARLSLPGDFRALNEYDRGCLLRSSLNRSATITPPFDLPLERDWLAVGSLELRDGPDVSDDYPFTSYIANDRLDSLRIRTWKQGDVLSDGDGEHKLKEIFEDNKIPFRARRYWPIVVDGSEILAVPGLDETGSSGGEVAICFRPDHPAFHQLENRYTF